MLKRYFHNFCSACAIGLILGFSTMYVDAMPQQPAPAAPAQGVPAAPAIGADIPHAGYLGYGVMSGGMPYARAEESRNAADRLEVQQARDLVASLVRFGGEEIFFSLPSGGMSKEELIYEMQHAAPNLNVTISADAIDEMNRILANPGNYRDTRGIGRRRAIVMEITRHIANAVCWVSGTKISDLKSQRSGAETIITDIANASERLADQLNVLRDSLVQIGADRSLDNNLLGRLQKQLRAVSTRWQEIQRIKNDVEHIDYGEAIAAARINVQGRMQAQPHRIQTTFANLAQQNSPFNAAMRRFVNQEKLAVASISSLLAALGPEIRRAIGQERINLDDLKYICGSVAGIAAASLAPYSGPFFTFMAYGIFDALEKKDNDFKTAVYNALPDKAKATGRQAYDIPEPGPANGNWD